MNKLRGKEVKNDRSLMLMIIYIRLIEDEVTNIMFFVAHDTPLWFVNFFVFLIKILTFAAGKSYTTSSY